MWVVMWRMTGGVLGGSRSGVVKEHGRMVSFETREAADAAARRLDREMNGKDSTAFRYWPIEGRGEVR
jgi:hypothetical protein